MRERLVRRHRHRELLRDGVRARRHMWGDELRHLGQLRLPRRGHYLLGELVQ
jgi:hypothetical protein